MTGRFLVLLLPLLLAVCVVSCKSKEEPGSIKKERKGGIPWEVVAKYPHDTRAFTQGLQYLEGRLYESTGGWGASGIREVELETGKLRRLVNLQPKYFGEGITLLDGALYQLTWRAGEGFVYDIETFQKTGEFRYQGEGWGLTSDGEHLIMSDGTATLRFLDKESFQVVRKIQVHNGKEPLIYLNELEYISGYIYSNIWHSDIVVIISPQTGRVEAWLDFGTLFNPRSPNPEAVLNGIAYDAERGLLLVTGKNWPYLYLIKQESL